MTRHRRTDCADDHHPQRNALVTRDVPRLQSPRQTTWQATAQHLYAGLMVGAAVGLLALSLARPHTVRVVCETDVLHAFAVDESFPDGQGTENLTPQVMEGWLHSLPAGESIGARPGVRIVANCARDAAATVQVQGSSLTATRQWAQYYATQLATQIHQLRQQEADRYRQTLAQRAAASLRMVNDREQSLALLMADFQAAAEEVRVAALAPPVVIERPAPLPPAPPPPPPRVNEVWAALSAELQRKDAEVQQLLARYTADHPIVRAAELQRAGVRAQLEITPKFLGGNEEVELTPADPTPAEPPAAPSRDDDILPIARQRTIQRTGWETVATNARRVPDLRPYLSELSQLTHALDEARRDAETATQQARDWEIAITERGLRHPVRVGDVRTTEHRRALPAEALTWALFGGAFVGLAFGWSRTRQEVPVLKNRDEIAWLVGVPVLGTVFSRRATDRPETSSQMWERYTLAGAEFVVVLIVAAYIASFWIDPRFAKTVAADPWLALADMWRRG